MYGDSNDFARPSDIEAVSMLINIRGLLSDRLAGAGAAIFSNDESLALYQYSRLLAAGFVEDDKIRRAANWSRSDVATVTVWAQSAGYVKYSR